MFWALIFILMSLLIFGVVNWMMGRVSGELKDRIVAMGLQVQSDLDKRRMAKLNKKMKKKRGEGSSVN